MTRIISALNTIPPITPPIAAPINGAVLGCVRVDQSSSNELYVRKTYEGAEVAGCEDAGLVDPEPGFGSVSLTAA